MKHLLIALILLTGSNLFAQETFSSFNLNLFGTYFPQMAAYSLDDDYNRGFCYHLNTSINLNDKAAFTVNTTYNSASNSVYSLASKTTLTVGLNYFWFADDKNQLYSGFNAGFKAINEETYIGEDFFNLGSALGITAFGARGTIYKSLGYFSEINFGAQAILMAGLTLKY